MYSWAYEMMEKWTYSIIKVIMFTFSQSLCEQQRATIAVRSRRALKISRLQNAREEDCHIFKTLCLFFNVRKHYHTQRSSIWPFSVVSKLCIRKYDSLYLCPILHCNNAAWHDVCHLSSLLTVHWILPQRNMIYIAWYLTMLLVLCTR